MKASLEQGVQRTISRGAIVSDFIKSSISPEEYTRVLANSEEDVGGYNFVSGSVQSETLWAYSNRRDQGVRELQPGIHAVSNGVVTDVWPKMQKGLDTLPPLMQSLRLDDAGSWEPLFSAMHDTEICEESQVPQTGMPQDIEMSLSSIFIPEMNYQGVSYGTRSQSLVMITAEGHVKWVERTREEDGSWAELVNELKVSTASSPKSNKNIRDEM